ncbi:MAG TPA: M28 family peptidase, partial [Gemmataceae bacterium]|nr:M28 family peptidase [Gemmataceae bacterium]
IEGNLKMRLANGTYRDLSRVQIQGAFILDMIAHNNDHDRDIFQIAPGTGPESMWLAYQAHLANEAWNASTAAWNQRPMRREVQRGHRSPHGGIIPAAALHPHLAGEIRLSYDPRSTLYNTDGQIFSDVGIPVVLFMENYDINRTGYHDTHDTMANIDLDYGSAVAAITIESVARAAIEKPIFLRRGKA